MPAGSIDIVNFTRPCAAVHDRAFIQTALQSVPCRYIYLQYPREGTFLSLKTVDAESLYWKSIEDVPGHSLPEGVPVTYPEDIPDTFRVILSQIGGTAAVRFTVPVFRQDRMQGFCVIHIGLSQEDTERYSRYSQTYINIFSGSALSAGSLPVYSEFLSFRSEQIHDTELSDNYKIPEFVFSEIRIGSKSYYQGKISFGYRDKDIRTVLVQNPEVPPSQLLWVINRVIYENIARMDESKHMTIVVLAAGREGKFSFSGLHEDMLIRRADGKSREYRDRRHVDRA